MVAAAQRELSSDRVDMLCYRLPTHSTVAPKPKADSMVVDAATKDEATDDNGVDGKEIVSETSSRLRACRRMMVSVRNREMYPLLVEEACRMLTANPPGSPSSDVYAACSARYSFARLVLGTLKTSTVGRIITQHF